MAQSTLISAARVWTTPTTSSASTMSFNNIIPNSTSMIATTSWTISFNNVSPKTYTAITGHKLKRGWNGKCQSRCSGCGRWAKIVPDTKNRLVECTRCLGEWERL